jgi:hypothetical protein
MKKKTTLILIIAALVIAALGFFVPLATYMTTQGCSIDPTPSRRLHLLLGQSINTVREKDVPSASNAGCSINTNYVLYLF